MICRLLLAFDHAYEAASEGERKEFMREFIERIELFPEKQPDGNWIRKIIFNFPVPVNGTEVKELPLEFVQERNRCEAIKRLSLTVRIG